MTGEIRVPSTAYHLEQKGTYVLCFALMKVKSPSDFPGYAFSTKHEAPLPPLPPQNKMCTPSNMHTTPALFQINHQALGDRDQYHLYLEEVDVLQEVWDRRRAVGGPLPQAEARVLLMSGRAYAQLPPEVHLVFLKIDRRVSFALRGMYVDCSPRAQHEARKHNLFQ